MNCKRYLFRYIFIISVLLTFLQAVVFSQGTDSRRTPVKTGKLFAGLALNGLSTSITNETVFTTSPLGYKKGNSFSASLDFGYFFSRIAGISIGIGYSSYAADYSMDNYSANYQATDSENENYEMQINGKSFTENQKISFMSIPVCINLRFPAGEKLGFFLKGGVSIDIPVNSSYKGSGVFTYNGYYPAYPVLLENLPAYGFPSNLETNSLGDLKINSINTALLVSGGIYLYLNSKLQLFSGVHLTRSLSNVSAYKADPEFLLTSRANELNTIMQGSSSVKLQSLGISLGLNYYFK